MEPQNGAIPCARRTGHIVAQKLGSNLRKVEGEGLSPPEAQRPCDCFVAEHDLCNSNALSAVPAHVKKNHESLCR